MKHLYLLASLFAAAVLTTACSDDDTPSFGTSSIEVVKSDVSFGPDASKGTIEIASKSPLTATSNAEWCKVSVSGNTVTVQTTALKTLESRSATVTISNGKDKVSIPVHQDGSYLRTGTQSYTTGYKATSFEVKVKANSEVTISKAADASWITYEKTSDGYRFHLASANKDRFSHVYVKTKAGLADTLQITQVQVQGNYTAYYYSYDENNKLQLYRGNATITEDGKITGLCPLDIPATISTSGIKIASNTSLGKLETYYLFTCANSTDGYFTWNPSVTYTGQPSLKDWEKSGHLTYVFGDDGSWAGKTINAFSIEAFSTATASGDSHVGSLLSFQDLILIKQ